MFVSRVLSTGGRGGGAGEKLLPQALQLPPPNILCLLFKMVVSLINSLRRLQNASLNIKIFLSQTSLGASVKSFPPKLQILDRTLIRVYLYTCKYVVGRPNSSETVYWGCAQPQISMTTMSQIHPTIISQAHAGCIVIILGILCSGIP